MIPRSVMLKTGKADAEGVEGNNLSGERYSPRQLNGAHSAERGNAPRSTQRDDRSPGAHRSDRWRSPDQPDGSRGYEWDNGVGPGRRGVDRSNRGGGGRARRDVEGDWKAARVEFQSRDMPNEDVTRLPADDLRHSLQARRNAKLTGSAPEGRGLNGGSTPKGGASRGRATRQYDAVHGQYDAVHDVLHDVLHGQYDPVGPPPGLGFDTPSAATPPSPRPVSREADAQPPSKRTPRANRHADHHEGLSPAGPQGMQEDDSPTTLALDEFPSLGLGDGVAAVDSGKGAWGRAQDRVPLAERLKNGNGTQHQGLQPRLSLQPIEVSVEQQEIQFQLRDVNDKATDAERRREVKSKRDFQSYERVHGREVNVAEGLELHCNVLNATEQEKLVAYILSCMAMGVRGQLRGRTFSAPTRSMKGKGRRTMQFGCCYNYAPDRQGRPKGIIPEEVVEPMPPIVTSIVQRLVRWGVLPRDVIPDSCIINVYEEDDCIPPHIDHHDFLRPFCTISLLSQQSIMFCKSIIPDGPGEFRGSTDFRIALPPGSCLVLKGAGADVAQHCVPPVTQPRMSITLRKMNPVYAAQVAHEYKRAKAYDE